MESGRGRARSRSHERKEEKGWNNAEADVHLAGKRAARQKLEKWDLNEDKNREETPMHRDEVAGCASVCEKDDCFFGVV